jgi:hypothetical protein
MEQHYTDKEFCTAFKINRSTSAEWREKGIVGYLKLPNGQIRYAQSHVDALKQFQHDVSPAIEDCSRPVKRGVVDIRVAKGSRNVRVSQ